MGKYIGFMYFVKSGVSFKGLHFIQFFSLLGRLDWTVGLILTMDVNIPCTEVSPSITCGPKQVRYSADGGCAIP